jgi:hypothetical protein
VCVKNGYKTVTPIQIANCLSAYAAGRLSYRGVRVYFGCLSLVAIREAANRYQRRQGNKPRPEVCFRLCELCKLTGLAEKVIKREIRGLRDSAVLSWGQKRVSANPDIIDGSEELLRGLAGKRSPKRPIPMPRSVLRFLAATPKCSLGKTMLAYVLRGLTIDRKGGEIRGVGSVKASWIADTFGLSLRSVKAARKTLIDSGFISKDTSSFQRKLNRDGAYFRVNLEWKEGEGAMPQIAPQVAKNARLFAPPYKDLKTSYEIKNQKAQSPALKLAGVCKANENSELKLSDVRREDLKSFTRAQALFLQAVKAGWMRGSESDFLNWMAAAIRANTAKNVRDPVRVFVSIVKGKRWELISQAQEERARVLIGHYRESGEATPRMFHGQRGTTEAISVTLRKLNL